VLARLAVRRVPVRVVSAGDRWEDDGVSFEVLHPPPAGRPGAENARSLVLRVRHRDLCILLTGDLEDPGLDAVLATRVGPVDVLMAPHHGSKRSNTPRLARWADPQVVVSCQGVPKTAAASAGPFDPARCVTFGTWPHGAVTVRQDDDVCTIETYRDGQRRPLVPRARRSE
jgi:competence protein ComEC